MPSYKVASWKPLIRDWHGHGAKPDLVMVSNDLDNWYVIEVELASHSISGTIAPQLETSATACMTAPSYLLCGAHFLLRTLGALTRMVRREPGLLCIVDQYTERLWRTCRDTGFELVVLEPYFGSPGRMGGSCRAPT